MDQEQLAVDVIPLSDDDRSSRVAPYNADTANVAAAEVLRVDRIAPGGVVIVARDFKHLALITKAEAVLAKLTTYENTLAAYDRAQLEIDKNIKQTEQYRRAVDALEKLQAKVVKESGSTFMNTLNELMEDLPMPEIQFDWDQGFLAKGRPITSFLSDGQIQMMFEPILRATAAKVTGLNFLCFDHRAPIVKDFQSVVQRVLLRSGCQVIQTMTQPPELKRPDGMPENVTILNVFPDEGEGARIVEAK